MKSTPTYLVKMAYKNGLQQALNGRQATSKTLAVDSVRRGSSARANKEKKQIGKKQAKSVKTSTAILLATLASAALLSIVP